jgi:hypothetical protein
MSCILLLICEGQTERISRWTDALLVWFALYHFVVEDSCTLK